MTEPSHPVVVNMDDVLADPATADAHSPGADFEARFGFVGQALGTRRIGATVTEVPPGKKAWPRHYHLANDEMFVILAGTGTLHHGDDDLALKPGDVAHLAGGTGIPFQIENTGNEALRYLALSTLNTADVFVYPDSGKFGFLGGSGPMRPDLAGRARVLRFIKQDSGVGYWDGEL